MKNKLLIAMAAILTIGMTSCTKDSSTGATGAASVNYQVKTINKTYTIPNSSATISWLAGYVNVTKVEFEAESANVHVKYETKASQKFDLFTSAPALGNVSIPAGTYTKAEFEIKFEKSSVADAFQLSGKYNATPIIFKVSDDGEFEVDAELANVTIAPDRNYSAMVTIDFSKLTSGISVADFNNAVKDNTGAIVISANTNASLYSIMKNNLNKFVANVEFQ